MSISDGDDENENHGVAGVTENDHKEQMPPISSSRLGSFVSTEASYITLKACLFFIRLEDVNSSNIPTQPCTVPHLKLRATGYGMFTHKHLV